MQRKCNILSLLKFVWVKNYQSNWSNIKTATAVTITTMNDNKLEKKLKNYKICLVYSNLMWCDTVKCLINEIIMWYLHDIWKMCVFCVWTFTFAGKLKDIVKEKQNHTLTVKKQFLANFLSLVWLYSLIYRFLPFLRILLIFYLIYCFSHNNFKLNKFILKIPI